MNLIAIETSTENCSVALLHQGKITEKSLVAPQKHAELVLGFIDDLLEAQQLKKSQIDGIVFGQGPGAFTGVRIAMSVVQGLALAWDVPVWGVSTLTNMAQHTMNHWAQDQHRILIANDARMGEVYWAGYEIIGGTLQRLTEDALAKPEAIETKGYDWCVGSAFKSMVLTDSHQQVLADALPDAGTLLSMVHDDFHQKAQNINDIQPSYIREKVVFN